jgi:hypothetical protein
MQHGFTIASLLVVDKLHMKKQTTDATVESLRCMVRMLLAI